MDGKHTRLEDIFKELPITRYAYRKAHLYSDIVSEIAGRRVEVYGYLIGPKNNSSDPVVRDVYLSHYQKVREEKCFVSPDGVFVTADTVKREGNRIMGWWHSHKGLNLRRHSYEDDTNFMALKYSLFNNNRMLVKVTCAQLGSTPYRIKTENDLVRIVSSDKTPTVLTAGFAYSLILTDDFPKPYCEIAVQEPISERITFVRGATLHLVENDGKKDLDITLLRDEVKERVSFFDPKRYKTNPTYKSEQPSQWILGNKIQHCLSGNQVGFDKLLREKLLCYASIHRSLEQTYLLDSADANKVYDVHTYLTRTIFPATKKSEHAETPSELDRLVAEVVSDIRNLTNVQIQLILQSIEFSSRSIRMIQSQIEQPSYNKRRELRKLRKQMDYKEADIEEKRALLGLWQSVKQLVI